MDEARAGSGILLGKRNPWAFAALLVALLAGLGLLVATMLPKDVLLYLPPALTSIFVFVMFWMLLEKKLGENVFGELGFLYIGYTMAHTVVPAISFMTASFYQGYQLDQLLPAPTDLRAHLWRHVLFESGVAVGYLILRGRATWKAGAIREGRERDTRSLLFVGFLIVVSVGATMVLSAPVESYHDSYLRYDHLPWLLHKFVSLCIRMSLGLYCVLLVFLFRNYEKYRLIIPVVVVAICAHEIVYSEGARIQALLVILQAVFLYHYMVRKISLKWGLLACLALGVFFSIIEAVRMLDLSFGTAQSAIADEGLKPSEEFISVFFPGFHLYAERAAGSLPPHEWPMFFNDFISLFTFGAFARWNTMDWYARNYYPMSDVAPQTLGPIADSAIWGGEWDLLARSVINGLFFAYIARWFVRRGNRWWGMTVYIYCCATCILVLKYSIFLHLVLIEKNLLPVLLLVHAARVLRLKQPTEAGAAVGAT
jgi:hypothetical protein